MVALWILVPLFESIEKIEKKEKKMQYEIIWIFVACFNDNRNASKPVKREPML